MLKALNNYVLPRTKAIQGKETAITSPQVEIKCKRFEAGHDFYTFLQQTLDLHEKVAPAPLGRSTLQWLLAQPAPGKLSSVFSISNESPWPKYNILQNISKLRKNWN